MRHDRPDTARIGGCAYTRPWLAARAFLLVEEATERTSVSMRMRAVLDSAAGVNAAAGRVFLHVADLAPAVDDRLDRSALELVTRSAPQSRCAAG